MLLASNLISGAHEADGWQSVDFCIARVPERFHA